MTILREKVFAYITHGERLLVFSHPDFPEAGIQVPAGTMHEGEDPDEEVMREAFEETGLRGLRLNAFLGQCDFPVPERGEMHRRRFYHLLCDGEPPERWRHQESDPGEGPTEPITFELFWVTLPDGVPELSPGHGEMLNRLRELMNLRGESR